MTFLLDMKTIFITLVIGHLFGVVLISAYWRNHSKDRILSNFFSAKSSQALAWLLLALRGGIPDIFTISIANSLMFLGSTLESVAILKLRGFYNERVNKYYKALTIINISIFHLIILMHNVENVRIVIASFGTAASLIVPTYRMITETKSSLLSKIMGYMYLVTTILLICRGIIALLTEEFMGLFTPGINQTFALLALYLVMIFGNTGFVLLLKENTDEELLRLASYDELTESLNRRSFIIKAEELLYLYARKQSPISYLLFDIDRFKQINDKFGHEVGDRVLKDISKRIGALIGKDDLFGRYGGDEFAIFLPGADQFQAIEFAERVRKSLLESTLEGLPPYTLSIGLTTIIPDQFTKIDSLYIKSDEALYCAKNKGRNCIFYEALEE